MRTVTRLLPVLLTDSEKVAIGDSLVAKMTEIDIVEADKREQVARHNKSLKELRAERDRLRKSYETGAEEREVECREEPGPDGTIQVMRLDTGEIIGTVDEKGEGEVKGEPAEEKRQGSLFERPGKACEGCGNADGTHHPECFVAIANGATPPAAAAEDDDDGDEEFDEAMRVAEEQLETGERPEDGTPPKKRRARRANGVAPSEPAE